LVADAAFRFLQAPCFDPVHDVLMVVSVVNVLLLSTML